MFHVGKISKLTVPILNLFPDEHHLHLGKMKKTGKVNMMNASLPNSEYHKIEQRVIHNKDNETRDEDGHSAVMSLMRIMQFY